ncbi:unnamed protein product [Meloidogyne enterolobii]|uniref:Uncharacterized protein n=1 Tax=Meloidogyne enterolobii TaxID=390850 RepID=A0ACB0XZN1_MELEN
MTIYLFNFFLIPLSHLTILSHFFIFFCVLYFSKSIFYIPQTIAIALSSRRTSKIKKFIFFVYWGTRPIF